jgi:hypothetical protein
VQIDKALSFSRGRREMRLTKVGLGIQAFICLAAVARVDSLTGGVRRKKKRKRKRRRAVSTDEREQV